MRVKRESNLLSRGYYIIFHPLFNLSSMAKHPSRNKITNKADVNKRTARHVLKQKDLEGLDQKIKEAWGWNDVLRVFQKQGVEAQLLGKDAVVHAGTGSGKTAIAAGPHVHPKSKGKVTIMVSPLIALQTEQVSRKPSLVQIVVLTRYR